MNYLAGKQQVLAPKKSDTCYYTVAEEQIFMQSPYQIHATQICTSLTAGRLQPLHYQTVLQTTVRGAAQDQPWLPAGYVLTLSPSSSTSSLKANSGSVLPALLPEERSQTADCLKEKYPCAATKLSCPCNADTCPINHADTCPDTQMTAACTGADCYL